MIKITFTRFQYDLYHLGKCVARIRTSDKQIERLFSQYGKHSYLEEINEQAMFLIFNPDYIMEPPQVIQQIVEAWANTHANAGVIICDEYEFENILKFIDEKLSMRPDPISNDTQADLLIEAIDNCL